MYSSKHNVDTLYCLQLCSFSLARILFWPTSGCKRVGEWIVGLRPIAGTRRERALAPRVVSSVLFPPPPDSLLFLE